MFDYTIDGTPAEESIFWSQLPLQPLAPDTLTPFSYSVLEEIIGRAWYQYFDRLAFEPTPRARVMRQVNGRAYLNLTLFAQPDAEFAGVEPLTLSINGQPRPVAAWQKPGLLASIKTALNQRKIDGLLATLPDELDGMASTVKQWYQKTLDLKWSQAEVLQVMEEIERVGTGPMLIYLAARHNLSLAYNQLARAVGDRVSFPQNVDLVNRAFSDVTDLVEFEIASELAGMSARLNDSESLEQWLDGEENSDWRQPIDDATLIADLEAFLDEFGHRTAGEGELSHLRWREMARPILRSLVYCAEQKAQAPAIVSATQSTEKLLDSVDAKARKGVGLALARIRQLLPLQSRALHLLAYVLAGTRQWARAAANEAMSDQRLRSADEVFLFELEEMKQMMTGEWNVSDINGIRATVEERAAKVAAWQQTPRCDLLIDDLPATAVRASVPGVPSQARGPLHRQSSENEYACRTGVVGAHHLDVGCSLALPVADAFIAAGGSPTDPLVTAARPWHVPTVLALGDVYDTLVDGAQTSVDGDVGIVDQ